MKIYSPELGFSDIMGPKLRLIVEQQLSDDLKEYGIIAKQYKFDWSESCIEGHETNYLDGRVENFSGINVFNENDEQIAEGWMEFIHEPQYDFFITYWEYLDVYRMEKEISIKENSGIPSHVYTKIPECVRSSYKA
ncbi:hypothetical protein [Oceanobacillus kapialis]|uniref:hypothetical protein n=1 Tax=Oceanobacillus kapialis TaxID=481353 RepID=UPI00384E21CB